MFNPKTIALVLVLAAVVLAFGCTENPSGQAGAKNTIAISSPAPNVTFSSGTQTIRADVGDTVKGTTISLLVNNTAVQTKPFTGGGATYSFSWNVETVPLRTLNNSLVVRVTGGTTTVSSLTVNVYVLGPPQKADRDRHSSKSWDYSFFQWELARYGGIPSKIFFERSADGGSTWTQIGSTNCGREWADMSTPYNTNYKYRIWTTSGSAVSQKVLVVENETPYETLFTTSCSDSDASTPNQYNVAGRASYVDMCDSSSFKTDYCGSGDGIIFEATCNGTEFVRQQYKCPNGCSSYDDACIPASSSVPVFSGTVGVSANNGKYLEPVDAAGNAVCNSPAVNWPYINVNGQCTSTNNTTSLMPSDICDNENGPCPPCNCSNGGQCLVIMLENPSGATTGQPLEIWNSSSCS
ncbi:MAG: hypothetical protein V1847_02610 [Candidatus Diapherotrites archaeon]